MEDVKLTHGGGERLDAVSSLLGRAFDKDPILRYMLCDMSPEEYRSYLKPYWDRLCKAAVLNDGIITEADGWKAGAVLMPPGKLLDNPWTMIPAGLFSVLFRIGISGVLRMMADYSNPAKAAKKKGLKGHTRYYYLFAIGTEYEHRGKGLARAIIKQYKERAQADQVPLWLEATNQHSRDIYASEGFDEIEKVTIGIGKAAADGTVQKGGSGVSFWPMVWWPESLK
ncbi:hypothetical protein ARAM_001103 [Aspergillus rambellii]|uniref:N-acetyltransferase domain-containing protein n=1 Tax=Aspergillus rambellii TaxID=308745 RepID=A0A0F8WS73_9EURO|nr:hypothetical protein ARAM_001103 [Aspergillus rambellii]